jgi:hypothetical protein
MRAKPRTAVPEKEHVAEQIHAQDRSKHQHDEWPGAKLILCAETKLSLAIADTRSYYSPGSGPKMAKAAQVAMKVLSR